MAGALVAILLASVGPRSTAAQEPLPCGTPVARTLMPGGVDTYHFTVTPGAAVVIQASDVNGTLGLIKLRVTGPGGLLSETCSGVNQFTGRLGEMTLQVIQGQCGGPSGGGPYTVSLQVVSGGQGSCAQPLLCGATPDGTEFRVPGEVDAFSFHLNADDQGVLKVNYLDAPGAPYVRVFDPLGNPVTEGCSAGSIEVEAEVGGVYTAIVSACGAPVQRAYRIAFQGADCPIGPVVTHFGVANAMTEPQAPIGYDQSGAPIYGLTFGQGFSLVVEARAGASGRRVGDSPVPYGAGDPAEAPDMQAIVSRPLGDGNPKVCDTSEPMIGGVPATVPFEFDSTPTALDIIADLGCRFIDGTGTPLGRTDSLEACTRTNNGFGFSFVDRGSSIQFCAPIASAWSFPSGDTRVAVRIKDTFGNFGAPRQIVVRVGDVSPATPTFTPTATATPPRPTITRTPTVTRTMTPEATNTMSHTLKPTNTATRTRTPSATRTPSPTATGPTPAVSATATGTPGSCAVDCNGDGVVLVNELTLALNVALGAQPIDVCTAADADGNGQVGIGEVLLGVRNSLQGCPGS